jgi:hypothetical protein
MFIKKIFEVVSADEYDFYIRILFRNSTQTGTVIATSPNAEKRYARILFTYFFG